MVLGGLREHLDDDPGVDDPHGGDELLRDCIERALAPHRERRSAAELDALRDYLVVFVTTHPATEPLYARLRKRPAAKRSTLVESFAKGDTPRASKKAGRS